MPASQQPDIYDTAEQLVAEGYPSLSTLAKWRLLGKGPPFIKFGKLVRYPRSLRVQWEQTRIRRSTSDRGEAA